MEDCVSKDATEIIKKVHQALFLAEGKLSDIIIIIIIIFIYSWYNIVKN